MMKFLTIIVVNFCLTNKELKLSFCWSVDSRMTLDSRMFVASTLL